MQHTSKPGGPGLGGSEPRLRSRTFPSMGTVVSLAVPAAPGTAPQAEVEELEAATAVVEQLFNGLDRAFSLYRPDSEASAMARGELALADASAGMRRLYVEASEWRTLTDGAFTAERPDGVVDLAGIVKAHALREAGTSLLALGLKDWCLNAGGDVLVVGSPIPGSARPWLAGIVDPADRTALLTALPLGNAGKHALATSGTSERGHHIWSAGLQGVRDEGFRQVSVAADGIITADVLATAIMAGGARTLALATSQWDVEVLAVKNDGGLLATPGFRNVGARNS
ncbi:FAD:protein FMN transferase [Arthrobacter bambusae]|uniref:FAD:protein FMN transferase n=1 Tax=Arthrobacter bambusae TaxID=1338426 RepID=UPI0027860C83|nr:FAD:protein FMN transferase [Arthrobacter bambusae]MDQ0032235.1 thiamine biosynthesis lipoprotein [Arthrobacter bambusae]MDQ0100356.1 thiamine biosynthesis lipoprotein [Arthrobacter bambusae]